MRNKILLAVVAFAGFGLAAAMPAAPALARSPNTATAPDKLCPAGATNLAYCSDYCPKGVLVRAYCEPPPVPIIEILSHPTRVLSGQLGVGLRCLRAPCYGFVGVTTTKVVTVHRGKRKLRRRVTFAIARGWYRLAAGTARVFRLKLDPIGLDLLRVAPHHRIVVRIVATVRHGRKVFRSEPIFLG